CLLFIEARKAATSYTRKGLYIKRISRFADLKNKTTFDDHFGARDGNYPALCVPAAIPSGASLLSQNH
ncbi:MAG TPA: hypothetical protein VFT58_02980, partial [Nitrososphaera sp.]|nr:hypothetical protein [Nitrososphaera sp.]